MLDLHAAATTYAVVLLAELPDKSLMASLALATRYRPLLVWSGAVAAFSVHVAAAAFAGGLLTRLPQTALQVVLSAMLVVAGLLLIRGAAAADEHEPEATLRVPADGGRVRVAALSFALVFMGELGDLTQIVTVNLAARYEAPFSVAMGSLAALVTAVTLVTVFGARLLRRLPLRAVQRSAGLLLLLLGLSAALPWVL